MTNPPAKLMLAGLSLASMQLAGTSETKKATVPPRPAPAALRPMMVPWVTGLIAGSVREKVSTTNNEIRRRLTI